MEFYIKDVFNQKRSSILGVFYTLSFPITKFFIYRILSYSIKNNCTFEDLNLLN